MDRTPAEALQEIIVVDDGSWPPLSIEPLGLAKEVHVMTTTMRVMTTVVTFYS